MFKLMTADAAESAKLFGCGEVASAAAANAVWNPGVSRAPSWTTSEGRTGLLSLPGAKNRWNLRAYPFAGDVPSSTAYSELFQVKAIRKLQGLLEQRLASGARL